MIWDTNGFAKLVGLQKTQANIKGIKMDKALIDEIIDVLDLELDTLLDDKEWDNITDKKLDLKIKLQKLLTQTP